MRFASNAQRVHLCAELIAASMMLEPFGEVGANFSLQLSSRTQFTKINNKQVTAENQCEKLKKSSLVLVIFTARGTASHKKQCLQLTC